MSFLHSFLHYLKRLYLPDTYFINTIQPLEQRLYIIMLVLA